VAAGFLVQARALVPHLHLDTLTLAPGADVQGLLGTAGHGVEGIGGQIAATYRAAAIQEIRCEVRWPGRATDPKPPRFVPALARHPGVVGLQWQG